MRWLTPRARRDEKGAVIVMMTAFVLGMVGMAALVVDVGALLDEKRQLQNGADAGALAVAQSCALGTCAATLATSLADSNSRDLRSGASVSYPATRKVLVETSTSTAGTSILPYSFAQILSGVEGQTVHARAAAIWGPVGKATVLRLAISQCDVIRLGFSTVESRIVFHDPGGDCGAGSGSGSDAPGNYGWLEDDGSGDTCELTTAVDLKPLGKPGNSPAPGDCLAPYLGKDILLPVFDDIVGVVGPGGNAEYTIRGFAKFHLTAYRFGPRKSPGPAPCAGNSNCIKGYFIRYVTPSGVIGGADFGVSTVKLFS